MAKKKKEDQGEGHNAFQEKVVSGDPSHFQPQAEMDGPVARPEAVDPAHLEPQAEQPEEKRQVKVVDPSHSKPQA